MTKKGQTIDLKHHIEDGRIIKTGNGHPIPLHEPLLLFRGRDRLALPTLKHYRQLCASSGCTEFQLDSLDEMIYRFEYFADVFSGAMKQPGSTRGK